MVTQSCEFTWCHRTRYFYIYFVCTGALLWLQALPCGTQAFSSCRTQAWLPWSTWNLSSLLLLFSRSVVSDSLEPHGLQHARLPCPSPSHVVCWNSCPLSWWCDPSISSSVIPFSSCSQSSPASGGSFPMSQFFASGGQSDQGQTHVHSTGRLIFNHLATREAPKSLVILWKAF